MKKFAPSNHKLLIVLLLLLAALAVAIPVRVRQVVPGLVREADQVQSSNPTKALSDYRVALLLWPHNQAALLGQGSLQLKLGQDDQALQSAESAIRQAQTGPAYALKARALLEKGEWDDAVAAANQAHSLSPSDNDISVLLDAALLLRRAGGNARLARARALYSQQLPGAVRHILEDAPELSLEESMLLAQSQIAQKDFGKAKNTLLTVVGADPANLEGHKLLKSVYEQTGDKAGAAHEDDLINQLETGKI